MPKTRQSPIIRRTGKHRNFLPFLYHQAMEIPFLLLVLFALILFFAVGLLFSCLYLLAGGLVSSMNSSGHIGFFDAFYFSVTFPVIGFGGLIPVGAGRLLSVFQVFIGLLYLSSLTGLVFARISKAKSPLVWSSPVVLHREDKKESLQVRVTNILGNDVVDVNIHLYLQTVDRNSCGETVRKLLPVPLEIDRIPLAAFSWILSHSVQKNSPLKKWIADLGSVDRLIGFIHGYDSTLGKEVFSYGKWCRGDMVAGTFDSVILKYREDEHLRAEVEMDLSKIDSVIREEH